MRVRVTEKKKINAKKEMVSLLEKRAWQSLNECFDGLRKKRWLNELKRKKKKKN